MIIELLKEWSPSSLFYSLSAPKCQSSNKSRSGFITVTAEFVTSQHQLPSNHSPSRTPWGRVRFPTSLSWGSVTPYVWIHGKWMEESAGQCETGALGAIACFSFCHLPWEGQDAAGRCSSSLCSRMRATWSRLEPQPSPAQPSHTQPIQPWARN